MTIGLWLCCASLQAQTLSMKVLHAPSADENKQCFYVHINTSQLVDEIIITGNETMASCNFTNGCPTTICYERPQLMTRKTTIECEIVIGQFRMLDGCTVTIWPKSAAATPEECLNLDIIANCNFGNYCDAAQVAMEDITHLSVGVFDQNGEPSHIAWAGIPANIYWYSHNSPIPVHEGAWVEYDPNITYHVKIVRYRTGGEQVHCGTGQWWGNGPTRETDTAAHNAPSIHASSLYNYPNPFSNQTAISFELEEDLPVTLTIRDIRGQTVETLSDQQFLHKGHYQFVFDGKSYPAGVYYYTLQAGQYISTQKMNIIR